MELFSVCVMCNSVMPYREVAGRPAVTCSQECRAARAKAYGKEYYINNRDKVKARTRQWRLDNSEEFRESERRYREENKEAIRENKQQYHLANREKINRRSTEWYQANRERVRAEWSASQTPEDRARAAERTRQWAQANPERRAELRRKWHAENPEKVAVIRHRRRARLAGIPADDVTVIDLMIDQGFVCYLCDEPMDPELKKPHPLSPSIDHIVPISRGGTSLRENLAAAHLGCNCAKGAKLLESA